MNSISQKIIAFFLMPMVLFSTTSYTIEKHICGDNVCSIGLEKLSLENDYDWNYLEHSEDSCCLDEENSCCIDSDDCCTNELIVIKGEKAKKEKENLIKAKKEFQLFSILFSIENNYTSKIELLNHYSSYDSPLIVENIQVLYQVFLI